MKKIVNPIKSTIKGSIEIPPDKSLTHRAFMFGALSKGKIEITNFSKGKDCLSTLSVVKQLGAKAEFLSDKKILLDSSACFSKPDDILDAGNSGTTIRLMSGILAGHTNFTSTLTGDASLQKRPMARIIKPLKEMGAIISAKDNDTKAPITIEGTNLLGIEYNSPIASAQVKSAILLAGINASGNTTVIEPSKSRDHTERMLKYLDANIQVNDNIVTVSKSTLTPKSLSVCGDISSAAFFMVAALIVPDACVTIQNVGLNPTRTGIIDVLKAMGADIEIINERLECAEEVGDIVVRYSTLKATTIEGDIIPRLIDEIPVLAVLATQAEGKTIIKDAEDLRHKESDRIKAVCTELKKLGAEIEETEDGLFVHGKTKLKGNCEVETYHDHRLAMSLYVAGLITDAPISINEFNWVDISFPEFCELFEKLKQD